MATKGTFLAHIGIDIDLSRPEAIEEFAAIIGKIRDAGYPEFAQQIIDGIESEGERLGFRGKKEDAQ